MIEPKNISRRFSLSDRLPPYVFNSINELKTAARARGEDIVDLGMGNPDLATPAPIVDKLIEASRNPRNHRYSASRGIVKLREAIAKRYARKWGVQLDPNSEVVVTIGAKEGLSHLVMTMMEPGDLAVVPEPGYPIHFYSAIIAGSRLLRVPATSAEDLLEKLGPVMSAQRPKLLILSFPNNPSGMCADRRFFAEVVRLARAYDTLIVHDFAYADLVFDGNEAPSILETPGARDIAVELFSLSKSYNMPGWRVGFCVGNSHIVSALTRVKSYLDYGVFQPIQIASILALNEGDEFVEEIAAEYKKRRDILIESMGRAGWEIQKPGGTMFVWAQIPERYRFMGSLEFSRMLLVNAKVAVSPGIGFGESSDGYVRLALVENEHRIRQAARGVKRALVESRQK